MAVNGVDIGKAYVQIVPSAEGIEGSITKLLGGETDKAGKTSGDGFAQKFVSSAISILGALQIGKLIADTVNAGAALQQSLGGMETLFGDSYGKIVGYANEAYKTVGMSANKYMETTTSFAASLLQSLGGDTDKAADAANKALIAMADNSNKMGTSMESIQNAYRGFAKQNYTMLDNLSLGYGGTKKEMERLLADAQKLTGVKYDINNLADVYEAISVIQDSLGISGTTAIEAAGTISGSLASMKAALTDFLGNLALGADITPSLEALVSTTSTFLFNNLIPAVVNIVTGLGPAVATVFQNFYPQLEQRAVDIITNFCNWMHNEFPNVLQKGIELLTNLVNGIVQRLPFLVAAAGNAIGEFLRAIVANFPTIIAKGGEIILNLLAGIVASIPALFTGVLGEFKNMDWLSIGSNIIDGIVNGVKNGASRLWQAAKEAASNAWKAAKDFLGIHSPSKKFMYLGEMSMEGLATGIEDSSGSVQDAMRGITNEMTNPIDIGSVGRLGSYAGTAAGGGFTQVVNNYSPKALSPSETARQTRNATRQLALRLSMGG